MTEINQKNIQKYSSAITLSDMEIFVFPELMYSLLLANIMSPAIWEWRKRSCFKKIRNKSPYRKLMRLKQFIMDEFEFNLDLNTWGLTSKKNELERFKNFISPETISKSNALFGYHGDSYYFDIDIRKHFGLDEYDGDIIPYWKTETIEAMNAFRLKPGYLTGAGECVSLSAVYAAAAFVVCQIPLEDIYMILTPLHSQNFLDLKEGIITNNRRLVTKSMWFNGTELSAKAQRALKNEQVTIIAHNSGWIHCVYDKATIDKKALEDINKKLSLFLNEKLSPATLANFLRFNNKYQKYFQFCKDCRGQARFIKAEKLFHYEHTSNFRIGDATHEKLLNEVDHEDYTNREFPKRIRCDFFIEFMRKKKPDIHTEKGRKDLEEFFALAVDDSKEFVARLYEFLHTTPQLPAEDKNFLPGQNLSITTKMSRCDIINYLQSARRTNLTADLAFYAYRDMTSCNWEPFIKACIQRSPVSIEMTKDKSIEDCFDWLKKMPESSIYPPGRLAHPDEVANYGTGDGVEKALALANIIKARKPQHKIEIKIEPNAVVLKAEKEYAFDSAKGLQQTICI